MDLCKFSNIGGEVGKGIHSIRLFNIAVVDVIGTIAIVYAIHYCFPTLTHPEYNFYILLISAFSLGIICHRLFCVRTTVDKLLFSN